MKPILALALAVMAFSSCQKGHYATKANPTVQKAAEDHQMVFFRSDKAYRTLLPDVSFYPSGYNGPINLEPHWQFLSSAGLPLKENFEEWARQHSFSDACQLYFNHIAQYPDHELLNVFKQYHGWLILTHFDMLSQSPAVAGSQVKQILNHLVAANYTGYGLMYYTMEYLKRNGMATNDELRIFADQIMAIYTNAPKKNTNPVSATDFQGEKPMHPGIIEIINKALEQEGAGNAYIVKIQQLVS